MLSECEVSAGLSCCKVFVEAGLASEAGAELHSRRLGAFRVTDAGCDIRNIGGAIQWQKQHAVLISHHEVVRGDNVLAAGGRRQGKRVLGIKALGTGRQYSQAEYGQPDDVQFGGVAVRWRGGIRIPINSTTAATVGVECVTTLSTAHFALHRRSSEKVSRAFRECKQLRRDTNWTPSALNLISD